MCDALRVTLGEFGGRPVRRRNRARFAALSAGAGVRLVRGPPPREQPDMTAAQDEAVVEECPPVGSGVMRGYLRADAPGGRFWFVLSNERLWALSAES